MNSKKCCELFFETDHPNLLDDFDKCKFIINFILQTFDLTPVYIQIHPHKTDQFKSGYYTYRHTSPTFHEKFTFTQTLSRYFDGDYHAMLVVRISPRMCFLGQANFDFTFQRKANIVTRAKKRARMSTRNRYCIIQPALLPSLTGSDQENDLAKIKDVIALLYTKWCKL